MTKNELLLLVIGFLFGWIVRPGGGLWSDGP